MGAGGDPAFSLSASCGLLHWHAVQQHDGWRVRAAAAHISRPNIYIREPSENAFSQEILQI